MIRHHTIKTVVTTIATLASAAYATVGPPIKISMPADTRQAVKDQPFSGTIRLAVKKPGLIDDIKLTGDGWRFMSITRPANGAYDAEVESLEIPFTAIPSNPDAPVTLSFSYNGRIVEKTYEFGPRYFERVSKPARLLSFKRIEDAPSKDELANAESTGPTITPSETSAATGDTNLRVRGRVVYNRPNAVDNTGAGTGGTTLQPAQGVLVRVKDSDDLTDDTMWEGYTDEDGFFDTGPISSGDPNGPDVYVDLETTNPKCEVEEGGILENNYSWTTSDDVIDDFDGGEIDYGNLVPATNDQAMHILNSIRRAHDQIDQYFPTSIPSVDVQWPEGNNAFYDGEIKIGTRREWNEGTHVHEYGHHLLEEFAVNVTPDYCNGYCDDDSGVPNCYMNPTGSCGHCGWCPETDHDAWNEGWPNWLADYVTRRLPQAYEFLNGDPWTALIPRPQENLGICCQDGQAGNPFLTENFVAALLTDIEDLTNDDHDSDGIRDCLNMGPGPIIAIAIGDDPITISQFINSFLNLFPEEINGFYKTAFNVAPAYTNQFPADTNVPGAVTSFSSSSHPVGVGGSSGCIDVSWDQPLDDVTGACEWSVLWTTDPSDFVDFTSEGQDSCFSSTSANLSGLGPETWYLGLRARDCAGNWAGESAMLGPFTIRDCDGSGLLDICDVDCDAFEDAQGCDVPPGACSDAGCGAKPDCNNSLLPDECDIADGVSKDCTENDIPDECENIVNWEGGDGNWNTDVNWIENISPPDHYNVCIDDPGTATVDYNTGVSVVEILACLNNLNFISTGLPRPDLTINQPSWIRGDLTMAGALGYIRVNDRLDIEGHFNWQGSNSSNVTQLNGPGTTYANGGATFSAVTPLLDHKLHLGGDCVSTGRIDFNGASELVIEDGATYEHQSGLGVFVGWIDDHITNNGTIRKTTSTGVSNISIDIENNGIMHVIDGTLNLTRGSTHTGSVLANSGTGFQLTGGGHNFLEDSSINADTVTFADGAGGTVNIRGTYNAATATIHNSGSSPSVNFTETANIISYGQDFLMYGGITRCNAPIGGPINFNTLLVRGTVEFNSGDPVVTDTFDIGPGTLRHASTITITGQTTWRGAGNFIGGPYTINAVGPVTISSGGSQKTLSNVVFNNTNVATVNGPFGMINGAVFNNLTGATFDITGDNISVSGDTFNNAGTFIKSAGTASSYIDSDINNTGTIDIQSGSMRMNGAYTQTAGTLHLNNATIDRFEFSIPNPLNIDGGQLTGDGNIIGSVVSDGGTIVPATELQMENYTQSASGTLEIAIAGTNPQDHAKLTLSEDADIQGGNLNLVLSYTPVPGDAVDIITAANITGQFDTVEITAGTTSLTPQVTHDGTTMTVTFVQFDSPDGDLDTDGDVDIVDYGIFQSQCFTGPNEAPGFPGLPMNCTPADFDTDTDIDLLDFGTFQTAMTP